MYRRESETATAVVLTEITIIETLGSTIKKVEKTTKPKEVRNIFLLNYLKTIKINLRSTIFPEQAFLEIEKVSSACVDSKISNISFHWSLSRVS